MIGELWVGWWCVILQLVMTWIVCVVCAGKHLGEKRTDGGHSAL